MLYGISSTKDEFPNGKPGDDEEHVLIVCVNDKQRKEVARAFKLRAHHIIPGRGLSGRSYSRIVIFTPQITEGRELMRFKEYIDGEVMPRLKYYNGNPQDKVCYV